MFNFPMKPPIKNPADTARVTIAAKKDRFLVRSCPSVISDIYASAVTKNPPENIPPINLKSRIKGRVLQVAKPNCPKA